MAYDDFFFKWLLESLKCFRSENKFDNKNRKAKDEDSEIEQPNKV
jgi:hypothetical protein